MSLDLRPTEVAMPQRRETIPNAFLTGPRVYLRGAVPEDAAICAPWFNDPEVNRYIATGRRPNSVEHSRKLIAGAMDSERDVMFAVIERSSGSYIGNAGLHRIHPVYRSAMFGIVIGVPALWHRGYGTEVTALVTAYAFSRLNLNRVELEVVAANARAQRIYERVGYRVEGTRRQAMYIEGRYEDVTLMAIIRAEWEAARGAAAPAQRRRARR
jgi:RimJ/RimL family protein N-acetyltransferase